MKRIARIRHCRDEDLDPHHELPVEDQRWCLYSDDGKTLRGRHKNRRDAKDQDRNLRGRWGMKKTSVTDPRKAIADNVKAISADIFKSTKRIDADIGGMVTLVKQFPKAITDAEKKQLVEAHNVLQDAMDKLEQSAQQHEEISVTLSNTPAPAVQDDGNGTVEQKAASWKRRPVRRPAPEMIRVNGAIYRRLR